MNAGPMQKQERIDELDVLRGFALLGVFIVHFTSSSFFNLTLSEAQQTAFLENPLDWWVLFLAELMFFDKANTLFATLFGMGFWIMLDRLKARGAAFERVYFRRVLILLVIGTINLHLLFPGDVLQKYALLGIILLLLRELPKSIMLWLGLALAVFGYPLAEAIVGSSDSAWDQFAASQEAALAPGEYWHWVVAMAAANIRVDFVHGALLGWGLYLFGRFLLGAWIIQQGWLQRAAELLPQIRRLALVILPVGLATEFVGWAMYVEWLPGPDWLGDLLHAIAVPILATGYALALIALYHAWPRIVAGWLAPVGRMALTAYVLHGAVFSILYLSFGFDLLPVLGPAKSFAIAVVLYLVMTIACRIWLSHFRMGPLEYLWRWATYGEKPQFKTV